MDSLVTYRNIKKSFALSSSLLQPLLFSLMGDPRPKHEQRRRTGRGIGRTEAPRGRTIREGGLGPVYRIYLIHPTVQIKRVLIDSSDLRIKHVNSKMGTF
jgi:hypothetical protein